ncbi:cytochrome P450 [Streptomyces europaeiscabiei]|uniref:Cytochrome P450 n=2 Tax=Streptomyces europaeiscabiei TaxID=146819 RepID=A0ABU4NFT8_9ACTN|nr:cytochrome P450 [Streptomyces europaeiscabiei]MDX2526382.1 cytochrome P450 [Streptomyces europaeiscabiei]MDX3543971.1 cytochrome P450 [Streptomyces europaeiscabiei]MDX3552205.1 cytochrome P450 [Streptomyces europaeiscabiei]MDX3700997.1 cytochrome P450 [Streptomyces europaeiscabiei]
MDTQAGPGALPHVPGAGRPVPEAEPGLVERWRSGGGELVALLTQVRERLGGVAAFRLGPAPTVLVTDPTAVQHVLARQPERYVKRSHRARLLIGDGVLAATGTAWKRQRRLLQSQFTGTGMRRYEQRITAAARTTAERWDVYARTGQSFDVGQEMRRFALDTIWRSLTGHPLDDRTQRELEAVETVGAALPTLPADADEARDAVAADLARIDTVARHAIAAARAGTAGPHGPGLLHVLTDAASERPEYTDRLIRDEFVTLLAAGHETTATTLTWLHLLLDRHPEAREQALAAGVEGSAERRQAIQALVHETLRFYPSAWILPRHATEDDTLAGYSVKAGTDLLVCPYLTHRDPELWPDPERFDPRRFTTPDGRPTHPGAYFPFGIGPRACLGLQFALRESTVLLEHLLPAHTPAFRSTPTKAVHGITVRPDGPTLATLQPLLG